MCAVQVQSNDIVQRSEIKENYKTFLKDSKKVIVEIFYLQEGLTAILVNKVIKKIINI